MKCLAVQQILELAGTNDDMIRKVSLSLYKFLL